MRNRSISKLLRSTTGAVAPTVALSLFGLIAAGGIAFDYARMASMDTELQSAADQAALAAASQLDGEANACERAVAAARGMVANNTLMANESGGARAITIADPGVCDGDSGITFNAAASIRFYQDINKTTPSDDDSNAKFVEVSVDPRTAFFALTPIVGALSSGPVPAVAFAGLDSAVCKVPPLMLCNPAETTDPDFTIANYTGKGIRLVANDGGPTYGPGNFGFLASGLNTTGTTGAAVLRKLLGRSDIAGDCVSDDGVTTEPGNMISVRDALNTRFDIYDNGLNQACGNDGSLCPPSLNTRKDLVQKGNGCGLVNTVTGNPNGWREATNPYPGTLAAMPTTTVPRPLTDPEAVALSPTGYPRDMCHAFSQTGSCTPFVDGVGNRIGDGNWDRYAYFRSHPTDYSEITSVTEMNNFLDTTFGTRTPTRYQVYLWEMQVANRAARLHTGVSAGGGFKASSQPICAPAGSGVFPSETQIDRRVLTVAVINCTAEGVSGRTENVAVKKWVDVFLPEPSAPRSRTENADVYVEVIGQTLNATDEGAVQLVKKSVPYLIE